MASHIMETLKQCLMRRMRKGTSDAGGDRLQAVPTCEDPPYQKSDPGGGPARPRAEKPDGGYGWVVVFASFLAHVTIYGVSWSVGMFNMMFLESFQQSKSATAWVGSLLNALLFVSGLLSSALVSRYGCRPVVIAGAVIASTGLALAALAHRLYVVYITFSGLGASRGGGVGLGLAYVPAIVSVSEYFERRRTIALGLAVSGVGFGCFMFPPIIRVLMETLSWRLVLIIIAVMVVCSLTMAGALMAPLELAAAPASTGGYFAELRECLGIMKTFPMLTLSVSHFLFCFGQVIVYVHLGAFAESSGLLSRSGTATLFSIIGVSNLVGRIIHGVICHFPQMATMLVFTASTLVTGVSTLLIAACGSVTSLSVCASVFGFASCCLGALTPDIIIGLVGEPRLAVVYAYLMLFEATGFMLGAPFAGLLFDRTETYLPSFYSAGALLLAAAVVMVVPWRYRHALLLPPDCDAESGDSNGQLRLPTPVKEPAQPEDFLFSVAAEGDTPDAEAGGRPAGRAPGPALGGGQRDAGLGEADSRHIRSETEESRLLLPASASERRLRDDSSAAVSESGQEEDWEGRLLPLAGHPGQGFGRGGYWSEPGDTGGRLLPPHCPPEEEEEDLGCAGRPQDVTAGDSSPYLVVAVPSAATAGALPATPSARAATPVTAYPTAVPARV